MRNVIVYLLKRDENSEALIVQLLLDDTAPNDSEVLRYEFNDETFMKMIYKSRIEYFEKKDPFTLFEDYVIDNETDIRGIVSRLDEFVDEYYACNAGNLLAVARNLLEICKMALDRDGLIYIKS